VSHVDDGRDQATTTLANLGHDWGLATYRLMTLIRRFDEEALKARIAGNVFGTMHPYIGQEAIAVGVCSALDATDRIISNHRGHGHSLAKGADPRRMFAELYGRVTGYCKGKGGSMHIADFDIGMLGANGIVGAGLPIAAGSALASQLAGTPEVTVAFFGDGASGQGVFHESMNLAAVWRLPMIFVCENNGISVETRLVDVLPTTEVSRLAVGLGIPAIRVDGNDVLGVRAATLTAVARARAGEGPTFIEATTHRWGVHSQRAAVTPDSRTEEELAGYREHDPIAAFADRLTADLGLDEAELTAAAGDVDRQLADAIAFAEASPWPEPATALDDLWASPIGVWA
jgi:pyruvate dehydrogenase E1 component alpha subunit